MRPHGRSAINQSRRTSSTRMASGVNVHLTPFALSGAEAEVTIIDNYATTINSPDLTEQMLPTLKRAADDQVFPSPLVTASEDFSFFAQQAPGLFFFLGVTPSEQMGRAAPNHSPEITVDDAALLTGIKALSALATDYLLQNPVSR